MTPLISIVINTDARAGSLAAALESLRWLEGPPFEVCVVCGPTQDGTEDVLARWEGRIKMARCPERNLSVSRNMGIALAAGEVVAFLDDDAIPEPEWLAELVPPYDDPRTGGAGGFVLNPDGVTYQYKLVTVDRLGRADHSWGKPTPELCFPLTANYPHLLGANSSFRRAALVGIGGFDEEFEYYLDETDIACRLVDAGWTIAQLEGAHVHHKFMPSALRNDARTLTNWYPIFKNRIYFGLMNGLKHHSVDAVIGDTRAFMNELSHHLEEAIAAGKISGEYRERFKADVDRAWRDGLAKGLAGQRRIPGPTRFAAAPPPFLPFATNAPAGGRRCFCFTSREYPPGVVGGIGRYVHELARGIAAFGHQVHVLTRTEGHDRLDFEEGVWVHRAGLAAEDEAEAATLAAPPAIASWAARMKRAAKLVASRRPIDAACTPIWDCEGLALLNDSEIPLAVALQTHFRAWLRSNPDRAADAHYMTEFGEPLLKAEQLMLQGADGILTISRSIAVEIGRDYGLDLLGPRTSLIPLGLDDWTDLPTIAPPPLPPGTIRLLFVGRLEGRKGIDVLLATAKRLLPRYPDVHLDVVGQDPWAGQPDASYRRGFEADSGADPVRDRVVFHGDVDDTALRGFYAACDVLVTPSRFESFGLMLVEGMMFGKPVIGCRAGGMTEVVEDGVSGLLAEPGDGVSLEACLEQLITDAALRSRLGAGARARYQERFRAERMCRDVVAFLEQVAAARHPVSSRIAA